jgi:ABC-2 type transport system ATP-binding protein
MDEIVIKTQGLTKDYGYDRGIFGVDLEVRKGEVFGFIGTNGSGKTTTIRNMMGFIKPDSGKSAVNGMDSWAESAAIMRRVSYVPGEIAFPALATGTEFLKSQADYLGVKDFTYMNHVIELLQLDPPPRTSGACPRV